MGHNCSKCPIRAKFEKNPRSLLGRFWRWHIDYCPGWKAYFISLDADEQQLLRNKYNFKKYGLDAHRYPFAKSAISSSGI